MEHMSPWLPIGMLLFVAAALAGVVLVLSHLLGPKRGTLRKLMPYESGMTPIGAAHRRWRVAFYLVAIEFLLFDVEIMFLVPYAVMYRELGTYGLAATGFFMLVLAAGYVYALKRGTLDLR